MTSRRRRCRNSRGRPLGTYEHAGPPRVVSLGAGPARPTESVRTALPAPSNMRQNFAQGCHVAARRPANNYAREQGQLRPPFFAFLHWNKRNAIGVWALARWYSARVHHRLNGRLSPRADPQCARRLSLQEQRGRRRVCTTACILPNPRSRSFAPRGPPAGMRGAIGQGTNRGSGFQLHARQIPTQSALLISA
jgi:hypothetical protein